MAGDDDDAAERRRMDALMTTLLHSQRSKGAFRKRFGVFDLFSVLLFSAMTIAAIASFSEVYWLFAAILAIDCAATVFDVGQAVAATRSVFFLAAIIASIVTVPYDIPFLVFEVLLLVFLLDVSFFLRKLESTRVDRSVFKAKSMSYFWVFVPALLLSYVPVYLYYLAPRLVYPEALVLLGGSSIGAFIVLYAIVRYLSSSFDRRGERYP